MFGRDGEALRYLKQPQGMQIIVYHSKARKTMCGMGTFCLIGMISLQLTIQNGDWRAFHKTIALNDTYTTVPLDIDMGGVFEVFVNATYDGFYNFDAARLSNTSIRVRCFRSGIQQTSGNVQISILLLS